MKIRILLSITIIMLAIGLLTACGGSAEIKDAQSLIAANKTAQEAVKSYHMDSDMDMEMTMDMGSLSSVLGSSAISMPMEMKMTLDSSKESAHGTTEVDITMLGQSQKVNAEVYCDLKEGIVYTKADGADAWTKTEQDASTMDYIGNLSDMSDDILSKAQFESSDSSYKLKLSAKDLGESIKDLGVLDNLNSSGVTLTEMNITEGEIEYTFDKEKVLLQKAEMDGLKIDASGSMQGATVDLKIDMDGDYEFSNYDKLEPKDYEIPDEVTKGSSAQSTKATEATEAPKDTTAATEAKSLPKATTQLTVSGGSTPNDQGWYVVGQDSVPAGSYKIFHGEGEGILRIKSADHNETKGDWTVGYGQTAKDFGDGTQLNLVAGDLIFITDDLDVVFDPVN